MKTEWWLLAIGFLGQGMFFMRFFVQWIYSEKQK
ncbi:MAG: lipid-A-disaccharide synthase N-terminal domain-containing protein, partial [Calditerrivibrio sp.]|nr:lipid-A-disaccharide synthase N-terminal domain-containing protein [Calditerrivibrio sp.]